MWRGGMFLVGLLALLYFYGHLSPGGPALGFGRRLAEDADGVDPSCVAANARPFDAQYPGLAVACYVIGMLFVFLGIAIVCDDHFCVALEVICERLNIDEQVAGATFMAAGSSAPELATSLVTIFTTKDSTGLGTILGSAVFNLVMIVCVSGIFGAGPAGAAKKACDRAAGRVLPDGLFLDWRPLGRDALFYVASIIMCVCFAISNLGGTYDGKACAGPGATTCSGGPDASKNTCLYYASREAGDARLGGA